jgi:tetratricopeptide (TPR) repeat protein
MDKAYEEYLKAYELDAERLVQAGDGYYIQILLSNYVSNNERDEALAMIEAVEPLAGSALAQVLDETRDGLFSDPEERVGFLESRLADNPGDESIIRELASMYENMGNRAKAIEFAEKLYELNLQF